MSRPRVGDVYGRCLAYHSQRCRGLTR
jgi:hypothetical protein